MNAKTAPVLCTCFLLGVHFAAMLTLVQVPDLTLRRCKNMAFKAALLGPYCNQFQFSRDNLKPQFQQQYDEFVVNGYANACGDFPETMISTASLNSNSKLIYTVCGLTLRMLNSIYEDCADVFTFDNGTVSSTGQDAINFRNSTTDCNYFPGLTAYETGSEAAGCGTVSACYYGK